MIQLVNTSTHTGCEKKSLKQRKQQRANLEEALAAAVKLHAEADAAGLTGAGKLGQQSSQNGAGQGLLQQKCAWSLGPI